nr:Rieske 2Fe-2S domain-containing protein [Nitrosomonas nitrosa]
MPTLSELHRIDQESASGRLLRRYWHPVAFSKDIPLGHAIPIKLLGEELVLWRGQSGKISIGVSACPHRRASLAYGMVEGEHLRCSYHGWLFDRTGSCVEKPFEPNFSGPKKAWTTYEAEEYAGLVFAYLGPANCTPPLPRWEMLNRPNMTIVHEIQDDLNCNWLQVQENAADTTHTHFLHGVQLLSRTGADPTGFSRKLKRYGFQPMGFGLIKTWEYTPPDGGFGYGNLLVFPNILALQTEMHWRVPIDESTTRIFWIGIRPSAAGDPHMEFVHQPKRHTATGRYTMETFSSQDAMAVETAGPIARRDLEQLSASDLGIQLFRKMLTTQVQKNEAGEAPLLTESIAAFEDLRQFMGGDIPSTCAPDPEVVGQNIERFEQLRTSDYVEVKLA